MNSVAIQGIRGSYSEEAARQIFGDNAALIECQSFGDTFAAVTAETAKFAVVPIENSIVGEIKAVTSLLWNTGLVMHERLPLEIRHVLVGTPDAMLEDLMSVRSHPEALKQCTRFLDSQSWLSRVICADTASSIREIATQGDRRHAAIGSRRAAEIYGARVLLENIAGSLHNTTTFCLISNR